MRGSDPIFNFRQGDHTCVFYWDHEGLLDILTPYIAEGLRKNERCFCAQKPETLKALCDDLRFLGVDIERERKRGTLELHTTNEVYFSNMRFDPKAMMELLERSIEDAVHSGYSGFRTAGELSWAVEGRNECDRMIEYEQMVQASFPAKPVTGMCMYPIRSFAPAVLDRVVAAHTKLLDNSQHRSCHASLKIHWPAHHAEIVTQKRESAAPYHYVVEERGGQLVAWGQAPEFERALKEAEKCAGGSGMPRERR